MLSPNPAAFPPLLLYFDSLAAPDVLGGAAWPGCDPAGVAVGPGVVPLLISSLLISGRERVAELELAADPVEHKELDEEEDDDGEQAAGSSTFKLATGSANFFDS